MFKDPFDFWEKAGQLAYHSGDVRIYVVDGQEYLFIGPVMYASTTERRWYVRNLIPKVGGSCLEIGLGLGVASKVILSRKKVSHLLTIEKNPDVIAAFGRPLPRHNILESDVKEWLTNIVYPEPLYDFIFVDHYTFDDEEFESLEELSDQLRPLLREGGSMVFWVDENAPDEDQELIKNLWINS